MKRLIFINQVANYLAEDIVMSMLNEGGYDKVTMVVGNPENLKIKNERVKIRKICRYNRSSFATRAKSWIIATLQILWILLKSNRKDEVFLVSNPPTACFCTAFCRNKYKSLIYDIYPDGLITGKFLSKNNPLIKLWINYNKRFFRKAEKVFTITEGMANRLSKYIDRSKIEVVPLWSNSDIINVGKKDNPFIKEHGLEEKFVVMYSGNIGMGHNVTILPEIARILQSDDRIRFVIIGEGVGKKEIERKIKENKLQNIHLLPYQPIDKVKYSLSAADLSFVAISPVAASVCVPSKTFNCIAAGSPLLCLTSKESELAKILTHNEIGRLFQPDDDLQQIAKYIKTLSDNPDQLSKLKDNVKNIAKNYSSTNSLKFI